MGENTKIEWCHHTFNPWVGCTKVGPPCDNCYAESWAKRSGHPELWEGERRRTTAENWRKPLKWNAAAAAAGARHRVFSASLADWLDNKAPDSWRNDLAGLIEATPNLDWLLLSKRIGNFEKHAPWHADDVPPNVWLGITCGDHSEYERDYPKLSKINAPVRFISYEPALGPLRLDWVPSPRVYKPDWVICGGESGAGARTMDPAWARMVRDICRKDGIAFFMKQMTGKAPIPADLLVREFPA